MGQGVPYRWKPGQAVNLPFCTDGAPNIVACHNLTLSTHMYQLFLHVTQHAGQATNKTHSAQLVSQSERTGELRLCRTGADFIYVNIVIVSSL